MSNITSLDEARKIEAGVDALIEADRSAAINAFELVYSRFMRAKARYFTPPPERMGESGDAYEAYLTKDCSNYFARFDETISTPAIKKWTIELLYELLREEDTERALEIIADHSRRHGKPG